MKARVIRTAYLQDRPIDSYSFLEIGDIVEVVGDVLENGNVVIRFEGYNHVIKYDCLEIM